MNRVWVSNLTDPMRYKWYRIIEKYSLYLKKKKKKIEEIKQYYILLNDSRVLH